MSYEAWGTPPDPEPQYCPLCGETEHVDGCEIKALESRHRERLEIAVLTEREACLKAVRGVMVTDHGLNTWKRCVAAIEKRSNARLSGPQQREEDHE